MSSWSPTSGKDAAAGKSRLPYDPVLVNARRELLVIVVLFVVFCVWSLAVCYFWGYVPAGQEPPEVSITLGMPSWVFWGIVAPWLAVDVVAVWFCFIYMANDDLGESHEGEDLAEQVQHLHESAGGHPGEGPGGKGTAR